MNENINLWFSKDENKKIITIDKANKNNKYICPICGGEVIPKALKSDMISPHFAHIDRESCEGESIIHWWTKNNLLKEGDVFSVFTSEEKQYLCKNIILEKEYNTPYGKYKPDVTIECCNGEIIFLEVGFTNIKKKVNYIDRWTYLNKPVIEFNIRNIYDLDSLEIKINNKFQAVYYDGVKIYKNDKSYDVFKNNIKSMNNYEEQIRDLEWFIDDVYEYKITKSEEKLDGIINEIIYIEENYTYEHSLFVEKLLKSKCNSVLKSAVARKDKYFSEKIEKTLSEIGYNYNYKLESFSESRLIWDKLYGGVSCEVKILFEYNNSKIDDVKYVIGLMNSKYRDNYTITFDEAFGVYVSREFYLSSNEDIKIISSTFNKCYIDNLNGFINKNIEIYENYKKGIYVKTNGYIFNYIDKVIEKMVGIKYEFMDSLAIRNFFDFDNNININDLVVNDINKSNLTTITINGIEYIDFNDCNNKSVIDKVESKLKEEISNINQKLKVCKEIEDIFDNTRVVFKEGYAFNFNNKKVLISLDGIVYYENLPILNLGYEFEDELESSINLVKYFLDQKNNITPYTIQQIEILTKLKEIYQNTDKKFTVSLEKNKYIVRDRFIQVEYVESEKSWKEINKKLSDGVRRYLYS